MGFQSVVLRGRKRLKQNHVVFRLHIESSLLEDVAELEYDRVVEAGAVALLGVGLGGESVTVSVDGLLGVGNGRAYTILEHVQGDTKDELTSCLEAKGCEVHS